MKEYYPNTYYMTVHEEFKRLDGSNSHYSQLMFNPATWSVAEDHQVKTKTDLKEKIEAALANVADITSFTVTETDDGWDYERFVKVTYEDDSEIVEIVEEGQHTDHEVFKVEISFYAAVDAMKRLERWEQIRAI